MPIPEALRAAGSVLVVSRLHEQRPARESVMAVAVGSQEFEIQGTSDEVLALSMLDPTGALSEAAMVQAGAPEWPWPKGPPEVLVVPHKYPTIVVVEGFTFQNVGVGSECDHRDVMRCSGPWYSAALYADGHTEQGQAPTSALVMHNVFRDNFIGTLLYFHARAVVRNNVFVHNTHGFVANHFQDVALLANNVFWENTREAIVSQAAYLDILNNVMARSEVGILSAHVQTGRIRCNLFFQNGANGADVALVPPRFEIGKDGNIELDPRFESVETDDFRPAVGSPVVEAGCFESLGLDKEGSRHDIGADGGPLGRWP